MHISRRHLLAATALTLPALALASCAGQSPAQALAQAAADVSTIAQGLQAEIPALQATGAIPAATLAAIAGYVAELPPLANEIAAAASASAAQPFVQQVESAINAAVAMLAKLPLPPQVTAAIQAVALLLPVVETSVGLIATQISVPAPATPAVSAARLATPDEARAYLRRIAGR